ncbi:hypothetical protein EC957_007293 [Mortierella hygrophila]|uniref:Uncharacterized protein n=1 Tax=Mortierella hygrophila TaxID=979708 RepID=A0A9P6EY63_9FUNG|nr:hypothetical protein EC957_007293 [Mortierella hygrophila]
MIEFRSSSTIVKQARLFDTTGANSLKMTQQQPIDERWSPGFLEDARVPRLGGSDHEDSPSTDMAEHTFLPQAQGNNMDSALGFGLGATNSLAGVGIFSSDGVDISSGPYQSPGPPMSMTMPMSSQMIQPQESYFGTMVEMPAPLANPRIRKANRSSRLNDKYARMKSDMEHVVQLPYSYPRVVRHQYGHSTISAPWNAATAFSQRPLGLPHAGVQSAQVPTYPSSSQRAPTQQTYGQLSQVGGGTHGTSTEPHQLDSINSRTLPAQPPPTKRVRIEENPPSNNKGGTTRGRGGVGGGAFSTPHFRMSTPARTTGVSSPSSHVLFPTTLSQGARRTEEVATMAGQVGEDGFDDWGLEDLLLDPEPMVVPTPNSAPVAQGYDNGRFASTATVKPTQFNTTNNSSSTSSQFRYSSRLQKSEKEPSAQDERPMTWLDQIHKLGSEIRAAAAATVPRFGYISVAAERGRTTKEERASQVQDQDQSQQQPLQQQQERARQFSNTEISFTLQAGSLSNVTGIVKRMSEATANSADFSNAKSLANDPAPVRLQGRTSQLLQEQQHAPGSERDECSGEAVEGLALDLGFLGDIEKEIQDLTGI